MVGVPWKTVTSPVCDVLVLPASGGYLLTIIVFLREGDSISNSVSGATFGVNRKTSHIRGSLFLFAVHIHRLGGCVPRGYAGVRASDHTPSGVNREAVRPVRYYRSLRAKVVNVYLRVYIQITQT